MDVFRVILCERRVIAARLFRMLMCTSWARLKPTREEVSEQLKAAHNTLCLPMQSGPKNPEVLRNARESLFKPSLLDSSAARE